MTDSNQHELALKRQPNLSTEGRPFAEHILNIIKAGLCAAPFTGAIASLMTDYIPTARSKRLEQFAETISNDLYRLQDRVVEEYLLTDDFAYMFEKCFRAAAENPQQEKLEAFRGILVNSAIPDDLSGEEKEFFLNLAINLSTIHIRILRFMATPEHYLNAAGIPLASIRGGFSQSFPAALPGIELNMIKAAYGELYRYGMLNTDVTIFGTMTAGQGLELVGRRVTEFGQRLIRFCSVPE